MANAVSPNLFPVGFQPIDGNVLNAALANPQLSSQNAITASTTQTRAGGTAITARASRVSVANASDAVTLLGAGAVPALGAIFWIANKSGQTIQVFPPGAGDNIDGGAVGAAVNLATACIGFYQCLAVVGGVATWVSGKMAVSS